MLPQGFTFREMTNEEFRPLWLHHAEKIFDENSQIFRVFEHLSPEEKTAIQALGKNLGKPFTLRLGLFHDEEFIGWHTGNQEDAETYYMRNSAILPEYRQKGLYTALLQEVIRLTTAQGFQRLYSRHTMANNAVIIPKLKAGFLITGFEVSDKFGTLVHLSYYANAFRRKMIDYRTGEIRPDEDIRAALGL